MNIKLKRLIVMKLLALDEIPRINSGGCAIVAFNLYRFLRNEGYYPDIVYLVDEWDETAINSGSTRSCAHAMVRVGKEYFDSTGWYTSTKIPEKWQPYNKIELSPGYVYNSIKHASWNNAFNREEYVPDIEEILA